MADVLTVVGIDSLQRFLKLLRKSPPGAVFNPWWEVDEQNDIGPGAPAIRQNQLRAYLEKRLRKAQLALIGVKIGSSIVSAIVGDPRENRRKQEEKEGVHALGMGRGLFRK